MKEYIFILLISSLLVGGCTYSTKIGVGGYSATHTASVTKYLFE